MQVFNDQPGWAHRFARNTIHPARRAKMKKLLQEFCINSTIHGLRNIESAKSLLERLWWVTVFVLSVVFCGILVRKVYHKWDNNPVIVSFDDTPTSVWKVPFPAITVCPQAKIRVNLMNFTDDFYTYFHSNESFSQTRLDQLMAVLQICDDFFHNFKPYQEKYPNYSVDVVALLEKLSVRLERTVLWCRQARKRCYDDFTQTLTEDGICFTYNGFSTKDMFNDGVLHDEYQYLSENKSAVNWSLEGGYAPGTPFKTHPLRGTGYASRFRMNLASFHQDVEAHCTEEQGFKVVLHSPDEYPMPFAKYVLLSLDRDINIAVRPQILITSKELTNYPPIRRQCFFSHERQLKFFRVYNQNNCELECITNFTLASCGCVMFSMPRSKGTRICNTAEQNCTMNALYSMLKTLSEKRLSNKDLVSACNCMSACSSINYLTEITQSTYDYKETIGLRLNPLAPSVVKKLENMESSKISLYFKGAEFIGSRRSELFGLTDFIANCGGIFGLCLGVSFVSLVELLYYCVVRPLILVKRTRNVIMVKHGGDGRY